MQLAGSLPAVGRDERWRATWQYSRKIAAAVKAEIRVWEAAINAEICAEETGLDTPGYEAGRGRGLVGRLPSDLDMDRVLGEQWATLRDSVRLLIDQCPDARDVAVRCWREIVQYCIPEGAPEWNALVEHGTQLEICHESARLSCVFGRVMFLVTMLEAEGFDTSFIANPKLPSVDAVAEREGQRAVTRWKLRPMAHRSMRATRSTRTRTITRIASTTKTTSSSSSGGGGSGGGDDGGGDPPGDAPSGSLSRFCGAPRVVALPTVGGAA